MRRTISLIVTLLVLSVAHAQLTFWTTEEQPERMAVQQRIAADFTAATGIAVNVVPVTESQLTERMTAAFAAGDLPDLVFHPVNYALGWAEAGILDTTAATEVIEELGRATFGSGALDLVGFGGEYTSIPMDGWTQLLLYRTDLFEEHGLEPPTTFEAILAAVEALHDPPNMFGFVAATDPSQDYFMQVFEHFALANGVQLVDDEGNVTLDNEAMRETLDFYQALAEASPPGNLYWLQSREIYQDGRAAMIVWSPFILTSLVGLRDQFPVTADAAHYSGWLAENTGFVTRVAGPSNPNGAGWAQIQYLGITVDADIDAAQEFAKYLLSDGYLDWLSMAAHGKFPVRRGTPEQPNLYEEGWSNLEIGVDRFAPLSDFFAEDVIGAMVEGLETGNRWGFAQGQGALVGRLYGTRIMSELVRDFLDGRRNADETATTLQQRVNALR
jgi:multiple sugar transport system substrate-binding protein